MVVVVGATVVVGAVVVEVVVGAVVVGADVVVGAATVVVVGVSGLLMKRSLLGDPAPIDDKASSVESEEIRSATWAGVNVGSASSKSAAAPATCGAAIEVPLRVRMALSLPFEADVMPTPGAKTSTQVPQFEKLARESADPVAPTVSADASLAGE